MLLTRIQKYFLVFFVFMIVFWLFIFFTGTTQSFSNNLFALLINLVPFLGCWVVIFGSTQWKGESGLIHKGLFFIGLGLLSWSTGGLIWSYYNFFLHTAIPYPSFADLGYAPSVFLYAIGTIYLSRGAGADVGAQKKSALFFLILIPILMLGFCYFILVDVARGGVLYTPNDPIIKTVFDLAYPVGDFFSLTASIVLSGLYFEFLIKKYRFGIIFVLVGLLTMFLADFSFSYTTTRNVYYDGSFSDLLFFIGMFCLTFGALFFLENKKIINSEISKKI